VVYHHLVLVGDADLNDEILESVPSTWSMSGRLIQSSAHFILDFIKW
jgi:hypothetical protein